MFWPPFIPFILHLKVFLKTEIYSIIESVFENRKDDLNDSK
jgi:hypothetical protein